VVLPFSQVPFSQYQYVPPAKPDTSADLSS